jgi:Domain of Unknown Function (DUF1080)
LVCSCRFPPNLAPPFGALFFVRRRPPNLSNWNQIGDANWKLADGIVAADKGNGFLVSKNSYGDFQLRAEFWVDADANSGIFIRCSDPTKVTGAMR